jgi:hypothetical protein
MAAMPALASNGSADVRVTEVGGPIRWQSRASRNRFRRLERRGRVVRRFDAWHTMGQQRFDAWDTIDWTDWKRGD